MVDKVNQAISAWLDNEAQTDDQDGLQHLLKSSEAQTTWQRYALIGSIMRNETTSSAQIKTANMTLDISAQVRAAVAAEAMPNDNVVQVGFAAGGAKSKAASRWLRPAASVAVAASVALVAVLSVQQFQQPITSGLESSEPVLITNPLGGRNPVSFNASSYSTNAEGNQAPAANEMNGVDANAQRRHLQSYMIDHQQQLQLRQQAEQQAEDEMANQLPPQ